MLVCFDSQAFLSWMFLCLNVLGPREWRSLTNGAELETRQSPLPLLLHKHKGGAQLSVYGVVPVGRFLGETANHDGCLSIGAHPHLVQGVNIILHVAGLMSREPLLLRQHKSERSYA